MDALIACTAEWMRVLKPSGSMWVNLGDKYASTSTPGPQSQNTTMTGGRHKVVENVTVRRLTSHVPTKSLIGIPWRYALRCIDDLGLILRSEVIWSKPNGLPESVTDRVRRSHEQWFHFVTQPRYFSAVDEIREAHVGGYSGLAATFKRDHAPRPGSVGAPDQHRGDRADVPAAHALGKLPGSVWQIATEPLRVPESLGIDHFAAFPTEWPRRIIQGWSPSGVCVECGDGRRPVVDKEGTGYRQGGNNPDPDRVLIKGGNTLALADPRRNVAGHREVVRDVRATVTGYACACPEPTAPTTPSTILDPFGGTGTTALVAHALGRHGISNDMSADYCRLAAWRTTDPGQIAKAMGVDKPPVEVVGQDYLDFGGEAS